MSGLTDTWIDYHSRQPVSAPHKHRIDSYTDADAKVGDRCAREECVAKVTDSTYNFRGEIVLTWS